MGLGAPDQRRDTPSFEINHWTQGGRPCGILPDWNVSLNKTAICIVSEDGAVVREGLCKTEPDEIAAWLGKKPVSFDRIGLEAGACSSWLARELVSSGLPVICIETRHASRVIQAQNVKTDRNDARGIAHMMRTSWFKSVHVKTEGAQKIRAVITLQAFSAREAL